MNDEDDIEPSFLSILRAYAWGVCGMFLSAFDWLFGRRRP